MKQMKRIEVFHDECFRFDSEELLNAEEAVSWMMAKFLELPAEYRHKASMSIKQIGATIGIEFVYKRLETDEEERYREESEKKAEANYSDRQLRRLKKLATKYGYTITPKEDVK